MSISHVLTRVISAILTLTRLCDCRTSIYVAAEALTEDKEQSARKVQMTWVAFRLVAFDPLRPSRFWPIIGQATKAKYELPEHPPS
jgi:hypothetical protein